MRIITPTEIESVAWEGYLEPLGESFKGPALARVTLGEPAWWSAGQVLKGEGDDETPWTPPAGDRHYTLVRLACTLHPPGEPSARYTAASLTAYLRPRSGAGMVVAHDLYPQRLTAEQAGKFTLGLGPDLKFASLLEASLFTAGAEIEFHQAFPVVQGYGLGESRPYWQFAHHQANPLLGCQSVYAVLAAPKDAGGVRLSLELVASLETRYGLFRAGLPQEVRAYVGETVGT